MVVEEKNPMNYGYFGDEQITISAREFMMFKAAVEHGINATSESYMPEVLRFINTEDSSVVESPSDEDLASGKVVTVTDREATFNPRNVRFQYSTKLTPDMVEAQELIMAIHTRSVEAGIAKTKEELEAASKKE